MRGQPYVFENFNGGVNRESAPYALTSTQARDSLNVNTSPVGVVKKRNGFVTFASPSVAFTSLFPVHLPTRFLIGAGGTQLYSVSTGGAVSSIKTALTSGLRWQFVQAPVQTAQGPIYGMNGTDAPQFWDGAAASTAAWTANTGILQNGKYLAYHDNRVYVAGVAANPSTLYWSDIIKPRDWASPAGGSTSFDPEDGQAITGIGKVGPYLLVFKDRKTYLVTDSNTGAYRRISNDIGCDAHRSIVETDSGTFFLSEDQGIVITDGVSFTPISLPVRPVLNSINAASIANSCAIYKDSNYYISIPTGATNDTILQYDLRTESWWIHKIYYSSSVTGGVNDWAILDPATTGTLYAAGADTSTFRVFEAFKANNYSDMAGQPYTAYWMSPWQVFSQPHIRKIIRQIRVDALGDFDLFTAKSFSATNTQADQTIWEASDVGTIFGGSGTFGGAGTFGDVAIITERRYYTPGTGRAWSLKFQSTNNLDMQIYSYTMAVDFRTD